MKKLLVLLICFVFLFELIQAQDDTITLSGQKLKNALPNSYIRDVYLVQAGGSCLRDHHTRHGKESHTRVF